MTSEDEISVAGSPSVTRRRLGSFNGQGTAVSGKEEKSPGQFQKKHTLHYCFSCVLSSFYGVAYIVTCKLYVKMIIHKQVRLSYFRWGKNCLNNLYSPCRKL